MMDRNLRLLRLQQLIIVVAALSGLALSGLFPIAFISIRSPWFQGLWILHVTLQLMAVILALLYLSMLLLELTRLRQLLYLLVVSFFLFCLVSRGLLPITSRDALLYHLAVPRWWLEAGRIVEISWHEWSHFPLMLSLGYAGLLANELELLTGFYHFTFLILSCAGVAAFLSYKVSDPEVSLVGALVCFTLPICQKLAIEPMSDHALAFYFGTAFLLFLVVIEQRWGAKALALAGMYFGLAMSVKYNSLLAVLLFPVVLALFLQRWGYSFKESLRVFCIVGAVALFFFLPWPLRNLYETGNPLYPFLQGIFGSGTGQAFLGASSPLEYRLGGYKEDWVEILFLPLRVLFQGEDDNPRLFDGRLSPFFVFGFVPLFLAPAGEGRPPWYLAIAGFVALFFICSFFLFYLLIRYQAPSLILAVVISVYGLKVLAGRFELRTQKLIFFGALLIHLSWSAQYASAGLFRSGAGEYFSSEETVSEFLKRRLDEYHVIEFVNEKLPSDSRTYLLFTGNRFYYYRKDVRGAYFSAAPLVSWLHSGATPEQIAQNFRSDGYTHLAIHGVRLRDTLEKELNTEQKAVWTEFVRKYLLQEFVHQRLSVWRIVR